MTTMPKMIVAGWWLLASVAANAAGSEQLVATDWSLATPAGEVVEFDASTLQRPALLLFWATWCPYCRALMPELQKLQESHGEGLDIYAINVWEDGDPVRHMADNGYTYTLLLEGDEVADAYGVKGTPGLFLIGADGAVDYVRPSGAEPEMVRISIEEILDAAP